MGFSKFRLGIATAILLVALFYTGNIPNKKIGTIICASGAFFSFIFCFLQNRAFRSMRAYEDTIEDIEKYYNLSFSNWRIKKQKKIFRNTGRIFMFLVSIILPVLWIVGFFLFKLYGRC